MKRRDYMCKKEGCEKWVHGNYDLCWEHHKETVPAYAEDMGKAVTEWLKYEGYTEIRHERQLATWGRGHNRCIFDVVGSKVDENGNPTIIGVEVKSDHDSFTRLKNQLPAYFDIFNYVYLCVDSKKVPKIPIVGILRFEKGKVDVERRAPHIRLTNPFDVVAYSELEAILIANGISLGRDNLLVKALDFLPTIRRKLIYNRFFADMDWSTKKISKHLPFTDEEMKFILQLGAKVHFKELRGRIMKVQEMANLIKRMARVLEDYDNEQKTL